MHGVQVQVTAVPRGPPTSRARWRRSGYERRLVRAETEGDRDRPAQPLWNDLVRPEHDVPGPRPDRTGQVPRRGVCGADREAVPETAGPAAEPHSPAELIPALVEHH